MQEVPVFSPLYDQICGDYFVRALAMDGSGTVNPADLNTASAPASLPSSHIGTPRGAKRPHTPEDFDSKGEDFGDDDDKPRKRGRPFKTSVKVESPGAAQASSSVAQTPQAGSSAIPQGSSTQASPPKSTPTTKNVKALPSVRDHTTDQLNPEGDEYIAREIDEAGERKVTPTGHLTGGRSYRCRTFFVPNRGNKLFMLATECARVLNYRDSYLLFNKNKSLHKIIAAQPEKDDLIHQEILPYAYRSRQIAIVTARSMFRQFGARMIVNGKRVRDDYWETKARKQGFTEDDPATEKRPGTTKAKEPATVELTSTGASAFNTLARGEIVYQTAPGNTGYGGQPAPLPSYPMLSLSTEDLPREYGNIARPRQDPSGTPYQDRSQPSATSEIINQAAVAAQYNSSLRQQRNVRSHYLTDAWHREHKTTSPSPTELLAEGAAEGSRPSSQPPQQPFPSPPLQQNPNRSSQPPMMPHPQIPQIINPQQPYMRPQIPQPGNIVSPVQGSQHQPLPQPQILQRPSNYTYTSGTPGPQPMYGYPQQSPMWPQQQQPASQLSPIQQLPPQAHHLPPYGHQQAQQSHQQQSPHPTQSPHHGGLAPPMPYQYMPGMGQPQTPGVPQQSQSQPGQPQQPYGAMRGYGPGPAGSPPGQPQQPQPPYAPQSSGAQQSGMQAWMGGSGTQGWGASHGY